jgi:hypothetical protein
VRHHTYEVLHAYARRAENEGLPRLGWIHHALLREPDYARFVIWFRKAKGWPA